MCRSLKTALEKEYFEVVKLIIMDKRSNEVKCELNIKLSDLNKLFKETF